MRISAKQIVTDQRNQARENAQRERAKRRAFEAVTKHWPESVPVTAIYPHELYGRSASVKIGDEYSRFGRDDDRCTLAEIADILRALPPLPMVLYRDDCSSFRHAGNISDEQWDKDGAVRDVFPVILEIDPDQGTHGNSQAVTWFTQLPGGPIVEVNCQLRPDAFPALVQINARTDSKTGRVLEVNSVLISSRNNFWLDQRIKWGTGGREYANKFTFYWTDRDCATIDEIVNTWVDGICQLNRADKSPAKGGAL